MNPRKFHSPEYAAEGDVSASLEGFLFDLQFTSNALHVIKFDIGSTTVGIGSGKSENGYSWDINFESHDRSEEFTSWLSRNPASAICYCS